MVYVNRCEARVFAQFTLGIQATFVAILTLVVPSVASADNYHLYVYNECAEPVKVVGEYFPFDEDEKAVAVVEVPPGSQKMIAVSDRDEFVLAPEYADGSRTWDRVEFKTKASEYTHVLSCQCSGQACPAQWPLPPTRQYAH